MSVSFEDFAVLSLGRVFTVVYIRGSVVKRRIHTLLPA
jgi:hypothetical protein